MLCEMNEKINGIAVPKKQNKTRLMFLWLSLVLNLSLLSFKIGGSSRTLVTLQQDLESTLLSTEEAACFLLF